MTVAQAPRIARLDGSSLHLGDTAPPRPAEWSRAGLAEVPEPVGRRVPAVRA